MGDQNERERTRTGGQRRGDVQLKVFLISNNDLSFVDSTERLGITRKQHDAIKEKLRVLDS